jgi:hypothetical protein
LFRDWARALWLQVADTAAEGKCFRVPKILAHVVTFIGDSLGRGQDSPRESDVMPVSKPVQLSALLLLGLATAGPVSAGTENSVMRLVADGKILPLETIRKRVQSQVRGDYIGAEWDEVTWTYRLRFVDNGNVINVDVDARTGQRVRRTANY